MGILTRRACEVLGKTDSLAIAYDCNPLEIKELLSSTQVYKSDSTQKITAWERDDYNLKHDAERDDYQGTGRLRL